MALSVADKCIVCSQTCKGYAVTCISRNSVVCGLVLVLMFVCSSLAANTEQQLLPVLLPHVGCLLFCFGMCKQAEKSLMHGVHFFKPGCSVHGGG